MLFRFQLFLVFREQFNPEAWEKFLQKENIALIPSSSDLYPPLLKEISNPPYLLYVKGDISAAQEFSFAIVGTRSASSYGRQISFELARDLAGSGLTIISGGAIGIDTEAHKGALEAHGKTVVVLAGGLDEASYFPKENTFLFRKITDSGGAILSEVPPGTQAKSFSFPSRNRLISGLSKGVLVVEAKEESGALITADFALRENREVFATPGNVYNPVSVGPHRLLQKGAHLVHTAFDILDALNLQSTALFKEARKIIPETPEEAKILEYLSFEPIHIDKIAETSGMPAPEVAATLVTMELKGKVKNLGGMNYVRAH